MNLIVFVSSAAEPGANGHGNVYGRHHDQDGKLREGMESKDPTALLTALTDCATTVNCIPPLYCFDLYSRLLLDGGSYINISVRHPIRG